MVDFFSDGLLLPLCSHWLPFGFSNLFQFRRKGMMSSVHFIWDYVSYLTTPDNREGKFSCFLRSGFILRWCDLVCWFWVHDVETGQLRATARPSHMYAGLILNPRHFGLSSPNSFPHSHNQSNASPFFFFFSWKRGIEVCFLRNQRPWKKVTEISDMLSKMLPVGYAIQHSG